MVREYKRKPATVLALKFDGDNLDEVKQFAGDEYEGCGFNGGQYDNVYVRTPGGHECAYIGDYIIKTSSGRFATCDGVKFERGYE